MIPPFLKKPEDEENDKDVLASLADIKTEAPRPVNPINPTPEPVNPEVADYLTKSRPGWGTTLMAALGGIGDAISAYGGKSQNAAGTILSEDAKRKQEVRDYLEKKLDKDRADKKDATKFEMDEKRLAQGDKRNSIMEERLNAYEENIKSLGKSREETDKDRDASRNMTGGLRREKVKQTIVDKFNADPAVKKQQQGLMGASTVRELVDSNNPIAASAIPTYMARASGEVGNLSEADKKPFGGSMAISERLAASLKQKASGTLTEDNARFLKDLANVMERSANTNMDAIARERAEQYALTSDSFTADDLYSMLRPSNKLPASGASGLSPEERKKRIAELKAKQAGGK